MKQLIIGGFREYWAGTEHFYNPLDDTDTIYNGLYGGYTWSSSVSLPAQLVSTPGTISLLSVELDQAPGSGKSYTFTVMVNGVASDVVVVISGTATTGQDTAHTAIVAAGDLVCLRCAPSGTPLVTYAWYNSVFTGTNAKESLILGRGQSNKSANTYACIAAGNTGGRLTEEICKQIISTPGKIKNLYVNLSVDPGTSPDAYRISLRVNGVTSSLTCTITADDTTGNDTTHEVTVAAGDYVTLLVEPLNTPSASPWMNWGMTFEADTDGESLILGTLTYANVNQSGWGWLACVNEALPFSEWPDIEESRYQGAQSGFKLKKLYVQLENAPGADKSFVFYVRDNKANTDITVTISGASTTGNDTAHEATLANYDDLTIKNGATNEPATGYIHWGLVCYASPIKPYTWGYILG